MGAARRFKWLVSHGILYAAIALLGLTVVSLHLMSESLHHNMVEEHTPLGDAAANIKYETSRFHLWFEEALATGDAADLEASWHYLDAAERSATGMLEGGRGAKGRPLRLGDPELRQEISHVLAGITAMRTAASERLAAKGETGIGTAADKDFDAVYNNMLAHIEHVERTLKQKIAGDLAKSGQFHTWINLLVLLMTAAVVFVAYRSERRHREYAGRIREGAHRLHMLMENANDAIFLADADSGIVLDANRRAAELIGKPKGSIIGLHQSELHPVEQAERYKEIFRQHVESGSRQEFELYVQHSDGRHIPVDISASVVEIGGRKIIQGMFRDITERKQAEEALRKYEVLFSQANDLAYICDAEGNVLYVNAAFERMSGHAPDEFMGKSFAPLFDAKNLEKAVENYQRALAGESPVFEVAFKDTGIVCEYKDIPYRDSNGDVIGVLGIARDVTERRQMEDTLRAAKEFSDSIVETAQSIVLVLNPDGTIRHINPFMEELSGYRREEVVGKDWFDTFLPEQDWSEIRDLFKRAISEMPTRGNINPIICKDGRRRQIQWYDKGLKDRDGNTVGLLAIGHDVTERQRMEDSLATERNNLLHLLNSMVDGVYIVDQQENVKYVNQVIQQEFGSVEGRKCYEYLHGRDSVCPWCPNERVFQGETVRWEWQSPVSGNIYDLVDTPINEPDGKILKLEIFRDITEHKKAEEGLKQALLEKEVLLREIHHRVKNNLQVVSSLLSLQAHANAAEREPNWLRDVQGRIHTMGLVHEHLCRAQDLAKVDFSAYIRQVIQDLSSSYGVDGGHVKIVLDMDEFHVDMDRAIPLGLIVNELVTNSLKHAYSDGRAGTIAVALHMLGDKGVELVVADDGVGMPKGLDWRNADGVGLQLALALVAQLEGEINLRPVAKGTSFAVIVQD